MMPGKRPTAALEPCEHPYHPDATQRARREMHHRFWHDWHYSESGAKNAPTYEHVDRYTTIRRDGSSTPWIIRKSRLADVADLERRRWALLAEYKRVAAIRWAMFQRIEGDYCAFYSKLADERDPEGTRNPAFYVYRVDTYDNARHHVEGTWESVFPDHGRVPVTAEKQPEVAYALVMLYAKMARRGYWLGMAGEVLDRAMIAKLPEQPHDTFRDARIEVNGRVYWYAWARHFWKLRTAPEDDVLEVKL